MSNVFRFFCCISSLQVTAEADILCSCCEVLVVSLINRFFAGGNILGFFLGTLQSIFGACVCGIKYFVFFQSTLFLKLRASDTERDQMF